jgi:hypothetical protein
VRKLLLGFVLAAAAVGVPTGAAAVASPTVRMTIVHFVQGCHVWGDVSGSPQGPTRSLAVKHGTRLQIRVNCPMSFNFVQVAGPKVALGDPLSQPGTVRTIVFAKKGVYRFQATNVETSEQQGLQTLGPDNVLRLTVRVS